MSDNVETYDTSAMEQPSIAEKIAKIAEEQGVSMEPKETNDSNAQMEEVIETSVGKPASEEMETEAETEIPANDEVPAEDEDPNAVVVPAEEADSEEYSPDYKFKVYDEEKEFDDFIKPHVTKENEEKIRDLYTRAYGIDGIKKKLDGSRQELAVTKTEMNQVINELSYLGSCIKEDNLDEVFKALNINQDRLEQWMVRKLQMTPEQREDHDKRLEATRRASMAENQYNDLNEKYNRIMAIQTQNEIQSHLDPDMSNFVKELDKRLEPIHGENGFMSELSRIGVEHFNRNKYDLPVKDAINLTLMKFGYTANNKTENTPTIKPGVVKPVTTVVVNNKNTIPSVGSGSPSSPAGKTYTSIEDLVKEGKRLRKAGK